MMGRVTEEGGPAAESASFKGGDIVLKFNGQDVKEMKTLPRIVAETPVGKAVPVLVWRDGKEVTVQASVGELPDDIQQASTGGTTPPRPSRNAEIAGLGAKLAPITDELRQQYKLGADQKGVVVTDVTSDGPAAARGLKPGDVIVEVQQQAVATPAEVSELMARFKRQNRKTVLMLVQSGEGLRWIPVPLAPDETRKPG